MDKTQRAFFNSITEWKHNTAEIAMCAHRIAVALKDLCASHRSDHAALGAGAPYISPTDEEMLTWRSGRDAAAGVAEELLFSLKQKTNRASLSCFHGASHLSKVPWREVEGPYSPGIQGSCLPIPPLPLLTALPVFESRVFISFLGD